MQVPSIGPATMRWLRMMAEDMRESEASYYESDAGSRRRNIINEAADELQRATNPCCCSKSCTRDKPITLNINPACPEHGDNHD